MASTDRGSVGSKYRDYPLAVSRRPTDTGSVETHTMLSWLVPRSGANQNMTLNKTIKNTLTIQFRCNNVQAS